jgi:hypothetical protein
METAVSNLILIPMIFTLDGMFLCWIFYWLSGPAIEKTSRQNIYRCKVCRHVYVDKRHVPLSRCGRCGCLNESIKR